MLYNIYISCTKYTEKENTLWVKYTLHQLIPLSILWPTRLLFRILLNSTTNKEPLWKTDTNWKAYQLNKIRSSSKTIKRYYSWIFLDIWKCQVLMEHILYNQVRDIQIPYPMWLKLIRQLPWPCFFTFKWYLSLKIMIMNNWDNSPIWHLESIHKM
jgi:hypothetical protein